MLPKTKVDERYTSFLLFSCQQQWKRIGLKRRAGVCVPLFSLYSRNSIGIGDLLDIKLLADWCDKTGMSMVQLLPMNDVGFDFRPYDAQSTFALDPMYLTLGDLAGIATKTFRREIETLRSKFPQGGSRMNYGVKRAKLDLLWRIFRSSHRKVPLAFEQFIESNQFWLRDYALFKVIKENHAWKSWEEWEQPLKRREENAMQSVEWVSQERIQFHQWLQWQLFEQFKTVKEYAAKKKILLMGDLPFLVSRDSADVWAQQEYFKLDSASGAPPDLYVANGQRWGMPPYHWENIARHGYDYLVEKLKYAESFYDIFRIDHIIGVFRLWTIALSEPAEKGGLNGCFDPADEALWEDHGRRLLSTMVENTRMLICGEDLGAVPACSYKVLKEFGIPGMDVQRWNRDWGSSYDFKPADNYRENSIAVISTHDMSLLSAWWEHEAGTVDEAFFQRACQDRGIPFNAVKEELFDLPKSRYGRLRWKKDIRNTRILADTLQRSGQEIQELISSYESSYDEREKFWRHIGLAGDPEEKSSPEFIRKALKKISGTASIFSIQLLQDWLSLGELMKENPWEFRVNFPGTMNDKNWSVVMPVSLEEMQTLSINKEIKRINHETNRI
ncbi:MAG: 4-alpha-glucanotransferase [Candidatus Omnitrophica bacterium]|nr:4-alpha-glucanotransferase [Candidatus Omnitrophota bacterium]